MFGNPRSKVVVHLGATWRAIAKEMGVGVGTVHRIAQQRSKNACGEPSSARLEVPDSSEPHDLMLS
jgi:transposase